MNAETEIHTQVTEIKPLNDGRRFAAKVVHYYLRTDSGEKRMMGPKVEFYGYTAEEAQEAAENAFRSTFAS